MNTSIRSKIILFCFLAAHAVLSSLAAWNLSPVWDEINYPFSGYVQLKTGSLNFYPDNPYLSRIFYGFPLFLVKQNPEPSFDSLKAKGPALGGFQFFYSKAHNPRVAIFFSRVPAILFSLASALLLYGMALSLWGTAGAFVTLMAYLSIPIFLSRASLALTEMPMVFFILLALFFALRWLNNPNKKYVILSGFFSAAAMTCKFTALPLLAGLSAVYIFNNPKLLLKSRLFSAGLYILTTVTVILSAFLFWRGGANALNACIGFVFTFNKAIPFFWKGSYWTDAPSLISWGAFLVKSPLFFWPLFFWSLWEYKKRSVELSSAVPFFGLLIVTLLQPLFLGQPVSTVQLIPFYIGALGVIGIIGKYLNEAAWKKPLLGTLLLLGAADVARSHPNYLSYFNPLAGGVSNGHYWLMDSDQDWGQSLPALGDYLKKKPKGTVFLSYSGAGNPDSYGISYVDLLSPALVSRFHQNMPLPASFNADPVYLAVGTKVFQTNPEVFTWLQVNRTPETILEGCFFVYDLTNDAESFKWLREFYVILNRPELAVWCGERAAAGGERG